MHAIPAISAKPESARRTATIRRSDGREGGEIPARKLLMQSPPSSRGRDARRPRTGRRGFLAALTLLAAAPAPASAQTVSLGLSSSTISEGGGVATVTASLTSAAGAALTVTVSAAPVSATGARASDFTLTGTKLTIAAGATASAGAVTITAVDNDVDAPDRQVRVSGNVTGGGGLADPSGRLLTITDDEPLPTVALALSASSISENGGRATVTASLSGLSSAAATITVSTAPAGAAVPADFTQTGTTLTIAAGATASTGAVTITAVDNTARLWGKSVTVSGTVDGAVRTPRFVTLDIVDDDAATVTLTLSPASISEGGGVATVSASLSAAESAATTITVSAAAGTGATAVDFTQTGTKLTIAAGSTASTGRVTITAVNDDVQSAEKSVTVSGAVDGGGRGAPASVTLTITDNEPTVSGTWRNWDVSWLSGQWNINGGLLGKTTSQWLSITPNWAASASGDFWACATRTLVRPNLSHCTNLTYNEIPSAISLTQAMIDNDSVVIVIENAGLYYFSQWVPITALPKATLAVSSSSISENGGVATVTATLDKAAPSAATITVAAAPGANAATGDFRLSGAALVFARGANSSTGTVTIAAVDNAIHSRARSVTVSGRATGDVKAPRAVTLTITEDDREPDVALSLSSSTISEGGGVATVTASLRVASGEATTIAVSAAPVSSSGAVARDFAQTGTTLTIAAGMTASAGAVTITAVNNNAQAADKRVTVSGRVTGGGLPDPASLALTITDNDDSLPSTTAWRNSFYSRVGLDVTTAVLVGKTAAQPIGFSGGTGLTYVIYACAHRRTTYPDGNLAPNRPGSACRQIGTNSAVPSTISLTQAEIDNDGVVIVFYSSSTLAYLVAEWVPIAVPPNAALTLSASSITENGGVATVTATLDKAALSAATITVAVTPGAGAMASDVSLSATPELVFASGATASTGTVTITAVDNDTDAPDKSVTVSGTVNGDVGAPPGVALTLTDDDDPPTVALALSPASIEESGGVASVTATLSWPSSEAVTVTVDAAAGTGAVAADFDLSAAKTLTIAAGATASAGSVTVTVNANDDDTDAPDKQVTVSGTVSGGNGVAPPADATLTIADDEDAPDVTLSLSASPIAENGGESTVTATLSHPSVAATTVTVTAVSGAYTVGSDPAIVIAAGQTANAADTATVTAVNDDVHQGADGRSITVTATVANDQGAGSVNGGALTLTDDETLPTVALALSPASVSENGGVASVTATLSGASSEAVTVTVDAAAGTGAVAADFDLSAAKTLTIAAGATASSGDVTVTANDNTVSSLAKTVTVSATVAGGNNVAAPADVTLTIADDDPAPVTLLLSPPSISESGGVSSVTATLSGTSGEAVTVTVSAEAGTGAVAADFGLSAEKTLTIAAGETTSTGDVTITANGNDVHSPDKSVTVSGNASSGDLVVQPSDLTLTVTDDETLPTLTLALSESAISETGGKTTVTATLSGKSSEALTVTVGAEAGTGAVAADFTLSTAKTLTFAVGATTSAGTVTVTANGNLVDTNDKTVTISATVAGGNGVTAPSNLTLTLTDDDTAGVTFSPTTLTLTEEGASKKFTVVLDTEPPPGTTWVGIYPDVGLELEGSHSFPRGINYGFTPADWNTAQTVSVNALADADHQDDTLRLRYVVANYGLGNVAVGVAHAQRPVAVTVTVEDDDKPVVTLALSEGSISEDSGVATVTATLDKAASEGTTVTVSASPGAGTDFTQTGTKLTIAAGSTASTGVVTITASDDDTDAPDKEVAVSATVDGGDGASDPDDVTLTLADDEAAPGVALSLSDASIAENGGGDDGIGGALPSIERGDDGDGDGGDGALHGGLGRGDRDRGRRHGERGGHGDGGGGGRRRPSGRRGAFGDGDGDGGQRPGCGERGRGGAGADRRRDAADRDPGAVVLVGLGDGRRDHGDGRRSARHRGGGGRLRPLRGEDADHRRRRHRQQRRRDGDGERQRRPFGEQVGDGLRHGGGRQRRGGAVVTDADADRR